MPCFIYFQCTTIDVDLTKSVRVSETSSYFHPGVYPNSIPVTVQMTGQFIIIIMLLKRLMCVNPNICSDFPMPLNAIQHRKINQWYQCTHNSSYEVLWFSLRVCDVICLQLLPAQNNLLIFSRSDVDACYNYYASRVCTV